MSDELENTTSEVLSGNLEDGLDLVVVDAETINADLIDSFETYTGETLALGDERRIFLQGFAYVLADQLIHINEVGRSNMLRYAVGSELDALGELYLNERLEAQCAKVTMRFVLSGTLSKDVIIPAGTRVTPDGSVFFATDNAITFTANASVATKDVTATATTAGTANNGYIAGEINQLVDTSPYISQVYNIDESYGGSETETDEEYRSRLKESPFSFSVAGPANAYRSIAMKVSSNIADVAVYSPSAGVVEIAVLKEDGVIPDDDDELLDEILEACDDKNSRPLTDKVQVVPATGVNINIGVVYYLEDATDTSTINAIEDAVKEYIAWQTSVLGRDVDPDELIYLLKQAGAKRVIVSEPSYHFLDDNEVAQIGNKSVVNGGSISVLRA